MNLKPSCGDTAEETGISRSVCIHCFPSPAYVGQIDTVVRACYLHGQYPHLSQNASLKSGRIGLVSGVVGGLGGAIGAISLLQSVCRFE